MENRDCEAWVLGVSIKFENTTGKYHVMYHDEYKYSFTEEWQAKCEAERLADILWKEMIGGFSDESQ